MKVTLKSIATVAGVSIGTVDRVMHDRGGVNEETKKLVTRVADELGYKSNIVGKALNYQRNPLQVAVIINAPEYNYFASEVYRGIKACEEEIGDFGLSLTFRLMYAITAQEQLALLDEACASPIDALIIKPIDNPCIRQRLNALTEAGVRVITCTSDIADCKRLCFVGHNHYRHGRIIAGLLCKMLRPDARVAIITGSMNVLGHRRKTEGFCNCLAEKRPDVKVLGVVETNHNLDAAVAMLKVLASDGPVDALCVQAVDKDGILRLCELSPPSHRPLICTFGAPAVVADLLQTQLVDVAVEENPYLQGYTALKTVFHLLFSNIEPASSFVEVDARIVLDESY